MTELTKRRYHADVKPENILWVAGQFKLTDIGFSQFERYLSTSATAKGHFGGIKGGTRTYGALLCLNASNANAQSRSS